MGTLTTAEWMRLRAGMFFGLRGDGSNPQDGIYTLLKEMLNNAVDEFLKGHGNVIDIVFDETKASVRDYGSGCPLSMARVDENWSKTKEQCSIIGKTIRLVGFGLVVTNAVSADFYIGTIHNGMKSWDKYSNGVLIEHGEESTTESDGTVVEFTPNADVFNNYAFREGCVKEIVRHYCYMNKDLTIHLNGVQYKSEGGLLDLVMERLTDEPLYAPIHFEGKYIEVVLTHVVGDDTKILSFVNGYETIKGGTHKEAFQTVLTNTFRKLSRKDLTRRDCLQGVYAAIRISVRDPYFVESAKWQLCTKHMFEADGGQDHDPKAITVQKYISGFVRKNLTRHLCHHEDISEIIRQKRN